MAIEKDIEEIDEKKDAKKSAPKLASEEPQHFVDCPNCQGTGLVGEELCDNCGGSGKALPS